MGEVGIWVSFEGIQLPAVGGRLRHAAVQLETVKT